MVIRLRQRWRVWQTRGGVLIGLTLGAVGTALATPSASLFHQALVEIERGDRAAVPADLNDHPLRAYLEAAVVRRLIALDRAEADQAWPALQARHPDHVENRDLEREWWRSLGRRGEWARAWAAMPASLPAADLVCLRLRAGLATGQPKSVMVPAVQAAYRSGRSMPDACDPAFAWLQAENALPPSLVAERIDLALADNELGLARYLIRQLPETMRAPRERRRALRAEPARAIPELVDDPVDPLPVDDLMAGWSRWIAAHADGAARFAPRLADLPGLTGAQRAGVWNALGLRWSWRREAPAVDAFRRAGPDSDDPRVHEWRIRAALWNGEAAQAEAWLAALPEPLSGEARWRYWTARVAEMRGRGAAAEVGYRALLGANNAYAALAAWRLDGAVSPDPKPGAAPDADVQARLAADPAIQRMHLLHALDLRPRFTLEWFAFQRGLSPADFDQLSRYAFAQQWWLHGVDAATRAGVFDDFERLYPRPYDAQVDRAARNTGLPAALINALIRQESLYEPRARSHANAYGLTQLLLPTARGVARRHGLPVPTRDDLYDPDRNVALGSRYLAERLDRFNGQWMPAIAAYNAGAGAVDRWLPERAMDADVWMENIPYNETRAYVGKLLWHRTVYAWQHSGDAQRPHDMLMPVMPGGSGG